MSAESNPSRRLFLHAGSASAFFGALSQAAAAPDANKKADAGPDGDEKAMTISNGASVYTSANSTRLTVDEGARMKLRDWQRQALSLHTYVTPTNG